MRRLNVNELRQLVGVDRNPNPERVTTPIAAAERSSADQTWFWNDVFPASILIAWLATATLFRMEPVPISSLMAVPTFARDET